MPAAINIPLETPFGKLTVKAYYGKMPGKQGRYWTCLCICGRTKNIQGGRLLSGASKSCGCAFTGKTHGHAAIRTPEYQAWANIKLRCTTPGYKNYYDRGIRIADEWTGIGGFERFLAHVGLRPTPKHTIERKNNDGNYEPGNMKWATRKEQALNRRTNHLITFQGITQSITEWAEQSTLGLKPHNIKGRITDGWTVERALTTPIDRSRSHPNKLSDN
jgi:hypothetical protein